MMRNKLGGYAKEWVVKTRKGKQSGVAGDVEFLIPKHIEEPDTNPTHALVRYMYAQGHMG